MATKTRIDTSYHDRRVARRLKKDPEYRAEYERFRRQVEQIDRVVNALDELRERAVSQRPNWRGGSGKIRRV